MTDMRKTVGRPYSKVVRIHKTYWVSEEEHCFITGYLRKRRKTVSMNDTGERNRFAEKEERIRKQQIEQKQYELNQKKLLRELKELKRISGNTNTIQKEEENDEI